jgi:hypothetical protein
VSTSVFPYQLSFHLRLGLSFFIRGWRNGGHLRPKYQGTLSHTIERIKQQTYYQKCTIIYINYISNTWKLMQLLFVLRTLEFIPLHKELFGAIFA